MRRTLDPEKTRETVLEAAFRLFAERGYAGTSVGDIAKLADVPKSLVNYHFGSKDSLWQEAFTRRAKPLLSLMERYVDGDPDLQAPDMLRFRFEFLRANPDVDRMLAWLSLDSAPLPAQLAGFVPKLLGRLLQEIGTGEDQPTDPIMRLAIVLGAMDGWLQNRRLYSSLAQLGEGEDLDERYLAELMKLLPEKMT